MSNKKIHDIYYNKNWVEGWLTAATYIFVNKLVAIPSFPEPHEADDVTVRLIHAQGKSLKDELTTTSVGSDSVFIIGNEATRYSHDGICRLARRNLQTNERYWEVTQIEEAQNIGEINSRVPIPCSRCISLPYALYITSDYRGNYDDSCGIPAILRAIEAYFRFSFSLSDNLYPDYHDIWELLIDIIGNYRPDDIEFQLLFTKYNVEDLKSTLLEMCEKWDVKLNKDMKKYFEENMVSEVATTPDKPTKHYDEAIPLAEGKIIAEEMTRDIVSAANSARHGILNAFGRAAKKSGCSESIGEFHQESYTPTSDEISLAKQPSEETEKPDTDNVIELKIKDIASPPILEKLTVWAKGISPFNTDNLSGYFIIDEDKDDYDKLSQIYNIALFKINLPGLNVSMGRLGYGTYSFEDVAVIYRNKDKLFWPLNQPLEYARHVTGSDVNVAIDICKNTDGKYVVTFDINAHAFNFDTVVKFCEGLEGHCGSKLDHRAREFINLFYLEYPYRVILDQNPIDVYAGPPGFMIVPTIRKSIPLPGAPNIVLDIYQNGDIITIHISAIEGDTTSELTDMRKMPSKNVMETDDINDIPADIPLEKRVKILTLISPQFIGKTTNGKPRMFIIPNVAVCDFTDMDKKLSMEKVWDYVSNKVFPDKELNGVIRITKSSSRGYRHSALYAGVYGNQTMKCIVKGALLTPTNLSAIKNYFGDYESKRRAGFILTDKIFDIPTDSKTYTRKALYIDPICGIDLMVTVDVSGETAIIRFDATGESKETE